MLVNTKMVCQLMNPVGQDRHLHLRRACVFIVAVEFLDDFCLFLLAYGHEVCSLQVTQRAASRAALWSSHLDVPNYTNLLWAQQDLVQLRPVWLGDGLHQPRRHGKLPVRAAAQLGGQEPRRLRRVPLHQGAN